MPTNILSFSLSILAAAVSVAVTFCIKDYLQKRADYAKLRKKLERIAGKNATVIYHPERGGTSVLGTGLCKIVEIDEHGITLKNELQTVFVPIGKLLQAEIILPCENYEEARLAQLKKDMDDFAEALVPALIDKILPSMVEAMEEELVGDTELSIVLGVKMRHLLEDEGYEIRKLPSPDTKKRRGKSVEKPDKAE